MFFNPKLSPMDALFDPYPLSKDLLLKNRIIMSPMTRNMADENLVPTQAMAQYYARRADAGLIITEGTVIASSATGYAQVPGIFTDEQIKGWKRVTDAVHDNGGKIFLQIWHVGRVSHPHFLSGAIPIGPSDSIMTGPIARSDGLSFGASKAATLAEIQTIIQQFKAAATNAVYAGFDGVEIHGANGYLIDQFLHHNTNQRQDEYGGSIENRARFALEVVLACVDAIGGDRVGIRLSPGAYLNQIVGDPRDGDVFEYLLEQLSDLSIAYVHSGNFDDKRRFPELQDETMSAFIRKHYKHTVIACGGYTIDEANQAILDKRFDLIAIGRPFLANPDLIKRLKDQEAVKDYDSSMLTTLY